MSACERKHQVCFLPQSCLWDTEWRLQSPPLALSPLKSEVCIDKPQGCCRKAGAQVVSTWASTQENHQGVPTWAGLSSIHTVETWGPASDCESSVYAKLEHILIVSDGYAGFSLFMKPFCGYLLKIKFMCAYWSYILAGKGTWHPRLGQQQTLATSLCRHIKTCQIIFSF